jgi:hypothetical protein
MTFVYLGADGQPEPPVVLDPVAQVRQVFATLEAEALQSAYPVRFVGFDDELPEEEELEHCARCTHPMNPMYLDEDGICEDCHIQELRMALSTAPFVRSQADWQLLVANGYVHPDEVPLPYDD